MAIAKVHNILVASISRVSGVLKTAIQAINGITYGAGGAGGGGGGSAPKFDSTTDKFDSGIFTFDMDDAGGSGDWILFGSVWNDSGTWDDSSTWND